MLRRPIGLIVFLASAILLLAGPALAHAGKLGYSEIAVEGGDVGYVLEVPAYYLLPELDPAGPPVESDALKSHLSAIAHRIATTIHVADGDQEASPSVSIEDEESPAGLVSVVARYRFPRPVHDLRIRYELFDPKEPSFQNLLKVHYLDRTYEMAFTPRRTAFRQLAGGWWVQMASFLQLGIEHIFTGYDHIAFIIGLLLLGGRLTQLLKIVSGFTVAHSITLIAAALGAVTLPGRFVESAIALSIAYIAAENLFLPRADWRWLLAFGFGLIHGFGFSSALAELGLPTEGLVASLLSFNLGVEVGQVAIVSALFPLILWSSRRPRTHAWLVRGVSAVILALGLFWFAQRIAA